VHKAPLAIHRRCSHIAEMDNSPKAQTSTLDSWENEGGASSRALARFGVDESPHNSDGLLLHGWDGALPVIGFISRRVMDNWADPTRFLTSRKSLFRDQYNALGKNNLPAIKRIVTHKYERGRHSTSSTPSSIFCFLTLQKAAKCSTGARSRSLKHRCKIVKLVQGLP
jgi:hypothetical protein